MSRLPSFLIIGAMKSATSTLYEQLLQQPGIFLPQLKEPNFFSNDDQYSRGMQWYADLFKDAGPSDILGEASTHYTKLPTYPQTIPRMRQSLDRPRLIYVMRDPVDRLVSQYVHHWSEGEIRCTLDEAVTLHPELIAYSSYAQQLSPFIDAFGKPAILPVFFDRLTKDPQGELERVCRFVGYHGKVQWMDDLSRRNVSAERVKKFPLYDVLVLNPLAEKLRRRFVPKALREKIRQLTTMNQRPALSECARVEVERRLDGDLAMLGAWFGTELRCQNFRAVTAEQPIGWR